MSAFTDADMQRLMNAIGIGPKTANAILVAVAPAIVARAQVEALREAEVEMAELAAMDPKDYPHKFGMQDAAEILRERIDEIERTTP